MTILLGDGLFFLWHCVCFTQSALLRRPKGTWWVCHLQGPELRHAAPENVLRLAGDSVVRGRVQTETEEKDTKLKLESSAKHFISKV